METPSAMSVTAFMSTERSADEIGLSDDMGTPVESSRQKPGVRIGTSRKIGIPQVTRTRASDKRVALLSRKH